VNPTTFSDVAGTHRYLTPIWWGSSRRSWSRNGQPSCPLGRTRVTSRLQAAAKLWWSLRSQLTEHKELLRNQEIALKLNLSEHTVRNYLLRIFDKLGISSRVELVLYAFSGVEGSAVPVG
jgi:hypothetical protein